MNTIRKFQQILLKAALLLMVCTSAAVTDDGNPARSGPTSKKGVSQKVDKIELLRWKMSDHRYRALAWAQMADFDEAIRELREADKLFQTIKVLSEKGDKGLVPWNFDLNNEVILMRLRAEAHKIMLKQFNLPGNTLGFIRIVPYKGTPKPRWSVIYIVPPKTLTKAKVATALMRYSCRYHIPGSRSYIAMYADEGAVSHISERTFKKVAEVAVPEGFTPTYVHHNNSGFHLVQLTGEVPGAIKYTIGAMLLREGKLVVLSSGPCAGPVVVPRTGKNRIDALIADPLLTVIWAVKKTDKGLIIAKYQGTLFHWNQTITCEGNDIVEIARKEGRQWKNLFSAAEPKRISLDQAKLLGRFYGMRHELKRSRVITGSLFWSDPAITFDKDKRQWMLKYSWGRMEISGAFSTIVLDEHGKLLDISMFIVPR